MVITFCHKSMRAKINWVTTRDRERTQTPRDNRQSRRKWRAPEKANTMPQSRHACLHKKIKLLHHHSTTSPCLHLPYHTHHYDAAPLNVSLRMATSSTLEPCAWCGVPLSLHDSFHTAKSVNPELHAHTRTHTPAHKYTFAYVDLYASADTHAHTWTRKRH